MERYKKNIELLQNNNVYSKEMEHDACGVGLVAYTQGKKSREVVEYGIEALKVHGPFKGMVLIFKRVIKCHPFNKGGIDPVIK